MQPWKISVGFTVIILALAALVGGERFTYFQPHFSIIVSDYWMPVRGTADSPYSRLWF